MTIFGNLEDCVYKDDENFTQLFENTKVFELWNKVLIMLNKE